MEVDAGVVDGWQEVQRLLEQAELPSPTARARSKRYLLRTQGSVTTRQQLAFHAEAATDLGDDTRTGTQEATLNDLPREEQAEGNDDLAEGLNLPSSPNIEDQPEAEDMMAEVHDDHTEVDDGEAQVSKEQQESSDQGQEVEEQEPTNQNDSDSNAIISGPITSMCDHFRAYEYCRKMIHHAPSMSAEMRTCIKLMDVMKQIRQS